MSKFVMSLASSPLITHPVELAASPFCHYHYSNLTKILRHWEVSESDFRDFIQPFVLDEQKNFLTLNRAIADIPDNGRSDIVLLYRL